MTVAVYDNNNNNNNNIIRNMNNGKDTKKTEENNVNDEQFNEQRCIKAFSQRIIRERTGNFPHYKKSLNNNNPDNNTGGDGPVIFDSADSRIFTNRGNKLLQNSECVTKRKLFNPMALNEDIIYYNGSEHKLLHRKKLKFSNNEIQSDDDEDDDQEIDLHKLVDVRSILTPIGSLTDIVNRPSILRIFQNKVIYDLSLKIVLTIEREQAFVNRYSNLLDIFLGDYPNPIYESILRLKEYDHNLILPDKDEDEQEDERQRETDENGSKGDDNTIEDPFFALPELSNKDGLKLLIGETNDINDPSNINEQLEMTRQLTQIALQRNEEFIRNLLKIRSFLDKANRIRERVLAWSKECVGIQDDDVTVPSILRVVKRGLISATTNKTIEESDEPVDDEDNNNSSDNNDNKKEGF